MSARYAPRGPVAPQSAGWYNYWFSTNLRCARNCPPGAHPLYIGKTNRPWTRLDQHEGIQSWMPHATGFHIYPEVFTTEAAALAAEERRIRGERPIANIEHNRDNPCRLYFPPLGEPTRHPVRTGSGRPHTGRPAATRAPWSRRRKRVTGWTVAWASIAVLVSVLLLADGHTDPASALLGGSTVSGGLLLAASSLRPKRKRRRR